ncbi:MAG: hypothetical protein QW356_02070 [Candidatus Hadarchaeales archaeon]
MGSRPWSPFRAKPIRLFGTNKTNPTDQTGRAYGRRGVRTGNCIDTVRGCGSTICGWCYAREATARYRIRFEVPVPQILKESLLRKQLRNLREDWVRIGVMGEPSHDWALTARVAEICASEGKRVVVVTRLLVFPSQETLGALESVGAVINVTVSPTDPDGFLWPRVEMARGYRFSVLRLISFAFANGIYSEHQRLLAASHKRILEQPARVFRSMDVWGLLDASKYYHPEPYLQREGGFSRWWTAGPLLGKPACEGHCPSCRWKCGLTFF